MSKALPEHASDSLPVEQVILWIRGQRVIVDADLARLYGVSTRHLNQAVRRNSERFPDSFAFRMSLQEKKQVVTDCDHLRKIKYSNTLPTAFTEYGALMAASVLNSPEAVRVSIAVVEGFIRMRRLAAEHGDLTRRIDDLERKYDGQFKAVFDALRALIHPPDPPRKRIGFHAEEDRD